MATKNLTKDDFETAIQDNDIVLVDFWASWCGPCRQFAPVYEAAAEKHPEIVFGKVDTEAEQELAGAANITSIPTLMAFREGVLVFAQPGALPATALQQVIDGVKELDMEDVHRQVEAQKALAEKPMEVDLDAFADAVSSGARVIDCREPGEYAAGHVREAELTPLSTIPDLTEDLATRQPVYIICASGNRSLQATQFLRRAGIEAYSVAGGTSGWAASGREVVTGSAG